MMSTLHSSLAIIPARGGSKELPGKNIRFLNKRPMIAYTIDAAIQSGCFDNIIVTTDDEKIAAIAKEHHAEVPFIRPNNLAADSTSMLDVILHTIDFYERANVIYDSITLLQPTSPLRNAQDILSAMHLFNTKNADSIISVSKSRHSPLWMNTLPPDNSMSHFLQNDAVSHRQILPAYYLLNGAIYIVKTDHLKKNKTLYSDKSYAYIMPEERSIDVDTLLDFQLCEILQKEISA